VAAAVITCIVVIALVPWPSIDLSAKWGSQTTASAAVGASPRVQRLNGVTGIDRSKTGRIVVLSLTGGIVGGQAVDATFRANYLEGLCRQGIREVTPFDGGNQEGTTRLILLCR